MTTGKSTTRILPCPVCWKSSLTFSPDYGWCVRCDCGSICPVRPQKREAIREWNKKQRVV